MGLDVSQFEAPQGWPCMGWDQDCLTRVLKFVKYNEEGTFRITKWGMVELAGRHRLQEVSRLFAVFEEAGDTSVSSLELAIALLLCNEHSTSTFKASECLKLFDWDDVGVLAFHDLLCLLQVCARVLAHCMHIAFAHVSRDDLERLCLSAIAASGPKAADAGGGISTAEAATVDSLIEWALSDPRTASVLAQLCPGDSAGLLATVNMTLAHSMSKPGQMGSLAGRSEDHLGSHDGHQHREGGSYPPSHGKINAEADGSGDVQSWGAAELDPAEQAELSLIQGTLLEDEGSQKFSTAISDLLRNLNNQLRHEIQREEYHTQVVGPRSPGAWAKEFSLRWAHALGEALPSWSTSWTAPVDCAPFFPSLAPELLRRVLCDIGPMGHACNVHEAQSAVALAVSRSEGRSPWVDLDAQAAAQRAAADQVLEFAKSLQASEEAVSDRIDGELSRLVELALPAARAVTEAQQRQGRTLQQKRENALRLEGALAYLASLDEAKMNSRVGPLSVEGAQQLGSLRGKASEMHTQLSEELKALQSDETTLKEQQDLFLTTCFTISALRSASQATASMEAAQEALLVEIASLRGQSASSSVAVQEELASTAAQLFCDMRPHWCRCEGALLAVRALARGQAMRYEMTFHQTRCLHHGTLSRLATSHLSMPHRRDTGGDVAASSLASSVPLSGSPSTAPSPLKRLAVLEKAAQALQALPPTEELGDDMASQIMNTLIASGAGGSTSVEEDALNNEQEFAAGRRGSAMTQASEGPAPPHSAFSDAQGSQAKPLTPQAPSSVGAPTGSAEWPGVEEGGFEDEAEHMGDQEEHADSSPSLGRESSTECSAEMVEELRRLRFRSRSLQAACVLVQDFLLDGTMAGIDALLKEQLTQVSDDLAQLEKMPGVQQRAAEKWRSLCQSVFQDVSGSASTAGAALRAVQHQTFELLEAVMFSTAVSSSSSGEPHPRRDLAVPPMAISHQLGLLLQGDPQGTPSKQWQHATMNSLGEVVSSRHAHAAYMFGSILAVETVELSAEMTTAWKELSEAGEHEMAACMSMLLRLAELKAEARMVMAVAEHHLALCSSELSRLGQSSGGTEDCARLAAESASSAEVPREVLSLLGMADKLLAELRCTDVLHMLASLGIEPALQPCFELLEQLAQVFPEHPFTPPTAEGNVRIAPIWTWWRDRDHRGISGIAPELEPCEDCLQWSLLMWEGRRELDNEDFLSTDAKEWLDVLIKENAMALRLWAWAQHRLLVIEAVTRKSWGTSIIRSAADGRLKLVEVLGRDALCQQQVGQLAATQQVCIMREINFLHTLHPAHAQSLSEQLLDDCESRFKQDQSKSSALLGLVCQPVTLAANFRAQGLLAASLEGVEESCEVLRATLDEATLSTLEAQLAQCSKLQRACSASGGQDAVTAKAADALRMAQERWGTLRAIEHLRQAGRCDEKIM